MQHVLVIEDNHDTADSLCLILQHFGVDVRVAYDGAEGLDIANHWHPDAVVCDIGLPTIDGYEVCRRIDPPRPTMIAFTGYSSEADKEEAFAAGFNYHFSKSCDPEVLIKLLLTRPDEKA